MPNLFLFNSKKFDSADAAKKAGELFAGEQHFDSITSYIGGEGDNYKIEVEEAVKLALRCGGLDPLDFSLAVKNVNGTTEEYILLEDVILL
jgi:hypothetical protein